MIARAPGKVVLAGAYAVLEGAEALVAAVDRYVVADAGRPSERVTPEVRAALRARGLGDERAPWFNASALRSGGPEDRKLGLGSSAAIVVASLAALELSASAASEATAAARANDASLATTVFRGALAAHHSAQGGGSGIDVAASAFGGVLRCQRRGSELEVRPTELVRGLVIEVWASSQAASTAGLVGVVRRWAAQDGAGYRRAIDAVASAAERTIGARDVASFVAACRAQLEAFERLGAASGAPIVTPDVRAFDAAAEPAGAVVLPSGAGGGDVALWVGPRPSDPAARQTAYGAGLRPLELSLGCRGVHGTQ